MLAKSKIIKMEIFYRWTFEIIQKFGQKMKNFKSFFDVHMDTSVIDYDIKKNFNFFISWPNFFHGAQKHNMTKKIFGAKFFVYKINQILQI